MAKIVWSRQSRENLRAIRAFIALAAPRTAAAYVKKLTSAVKRLEKFPFSGGVVSEIGRPDIREVLHGNYRIIYRASRSRVEILTVFHSARLLDERALFGDN